MSHGNATAPYGNYRGYYPRRRAKNDLPADKDERLALLNEEWFRQATVLDVGCNVGAVSVEIAQRMHPLKVVGVDIDPHLISQCRLTVERAMSMEKPRRLRPLEGEHMRPSGAIDLQEGFHQEGPPKKRRRREKVDPSAITLPSLNDVKQTTRSHDETHYFPSFFADVYGPIDPRAHKLFDPTSLSEAERRGEIFPHNLSFFAGDWVTDSVDTEKDGYDVILALSLTKWIHLNHLDNGLIAFFEKCHRHLRPGGRLVLEKQGWDGYRTAKRGSEILTSNYFKLKLRPEVDFERILLGDVGFSSKALLRHSDSGKGFDRAIEVYLK